ncbi:MAG: hypothetical protein ACXW4B_05820 [Micavibrio sp.]
MKTKGPALKRSFNTASVPPKDMAVMKDYHDPITGARLACVQIPALYADKAGLQTGPVYLVGWIPAGRHKMIGGVACASEAAAEKKFNDQRAIGTPPREADFDRDWQRDRVYKWEAKNTGRRDMFLTIEQMAHVIGQVSQDFGIEPPKFRYVTPKEGVQNYYNYYISETHTVEMRDKKLSVLLHEMAHALDFKINKNQTNVHHGPSFMRTLLCLAQRYQWMDAATLEKSLEKSGIKIAPLDDLPELKAQLDVLKTRPRSFTQLRVVPILK